VFSSERVKLPTDAGTILDACSRCVRRCRPLLVAVADAASCFSVDAASLLTPCLIDLVFDLAACPQARPGCSHLRRIYVSTGLSVKASRESGTGNVTRGVTGFLICPG
jgi:hypothetical protein